MGVDIPVDPPVFLDDKWYCVSISMYQGGGPPYDCTQNWVADFSCCKPGWFITAWLEGGMECNSAYPELCVATGYSAQKLNSFTGPYDDMDSCFENCGI